MNTASWLFLTAAAFIFYALLGYPLLLLLWGRLAPRPVHRAAFFPTVSVLIPVRNGERWIADKLRSVLALNYPQERIEVIVISDGSTDKTAPIVRQFPGVQLLELPAGGKCVALNAAMLRAHNEILFLTDVRQRLDSNCLRQLCACFADPNIGVVSGELVILEGDRHEHARLGLYMRFEEWLRKQISLVGSVAGATGAVYAIRRKLAVPLPADILLDDVFQPISAYFQGYRVILDGSAIAYDSPTSLGTEFHRKVRTLAGLFQIVYHFPGLLNPRHDIWIHFASHKLVRLLMPYAFGLLLISSFWLPDPWRIPVLAAQAVFYGLALLDFVLPESVPLKRLSSLNRTFLTLLAASVAAGSILFRPSLSLWTTDRR